MPMKIARQEAQAETLVSQGELFSGELYISLSVSLLLRRTPRLLSPTDMATITVLASPRAISSEVRRIFRVSSPYRTNSIVSIIIQTQTATVITFITFIALDDGVVVASSIIIAPVAFAAMAIMMSLLVVAIKATATLAITAVIASVAVAFMATTRRDIIIAMAANATGAIIMLLATTTPSSKAMKVMKVMTVAVCVCIIMLTILLVRYGDDTLNMRLTSDEIARGLASTVIVAISVGLSSLGVLLRSRDTDKEI